MTNTVSEKVRVGIVGVGNWAKYGHIPALRLIAGYEITAVSSRRKETAEEIAKTFGISKAFSDYRDLVRDPEVDMVIVLPPAPQHAEVVKAAIAAGKDVYSEWPLTTSTADSEELLKLAKAAGVRHVIGLQRRLGPSAQYLRDLVDSKYVGEIRSVRVHVSMPYFHQERPPALAWTLGAKNFSHVLAIYVGHFLDMLFHAVGQPKTLSSIIATQFPNLTLSATGESFPNDTPDAIVGIGTLENGALLSFQVEGGKLHNSGLQIDITGTEGDLKISNSSSFGHAKENLIEGGQGAKTPFLELPIPATYSHIPPSTLDVSVEDLAHLYAAHLEDRKNGTQIAPDFRASVRMHKLIDLMYAGSSTGVLQAVGADDEASSRS
jgi:predicted dehydrogenase